MKQHSPMNQLVPCPSCRRHVRQSEESCPFCSSALSLSHVPEAVLPRGRLGRAATFAFGATLASATVLAACGGESESGKEGSGGTSAAGASAGSSSASGSNSGGSSSQAGTAAGGAGVAGQAQGGTGFGPVYGAPPGGTGNDNTSGSAGQASGGTGTAGPVYGAPPGGFGNEAGGSPGVPVYGAAPAD
jgi:hypothetical protein